MKIMVMPIDWAAPRRHSIPRHGLDPRFSRLARNLRDDREPGILATQVHATLVRIVDDRLMAHHGIDRVRDPAAAQALLGEDLARYVEEPPTARRGQIEFIHDLISRIEAL